MSDLYAWMPFASREPSADNPHGLSGGLQRGWDHIGDECQRAKDAGATGVVWHRPRGEYRAESRMTLDSGLLTMEKGETPEYLDTRIATDAIRRVRAMGLDIIAYFGSPFAESMQATISNPCAFAIRAYRAMQPFIDEGCSIALDEGRKAQPGTTHESLNAALHDLLTSRGATFYCEAIPESRTPWPALCLERFASGIVDRRARFERRGLPDIRVWRAIERGDDPDGAYEDHRDILNSIRYADMYDWLRDCEATGTVPCVSPKLIESAVKYLGGT